jgi:hypothetical protein
MTSTSIEIQGYNEQLDQGIELDETSIRRLTQDTSRRACCCFPIKRADAPAVDLRNPVISVNGQRSTSPSRQRWSLRDRWRLGHMQHVL